MKKKLAVVLLLGMMASCLPLTAHAQEVETAEGTVTVTNDEGITTYAEEVAWVYRTYKGHKQKRLWSLTEGEWLTDWININ
jgi:hypothetical protein